MHPSHTIIALTDCMLDATEPPPSSGLPGCGHLRNVIVLQKWPLERKPAFQRQHNHMRAPSTPPARQARRHPRTEPVLRVSSSSCNKYLIH